MNAEIHPIDTATTDYVQMTERIVDTIFRENAHRSGEITAGIDGEQYHAHDMERLVMLLTDNTASAALRIAALGHDIERVVELGAGSGYEKSRTGQEYVAYKKRHAARGAEIMAEKLKDAHVSQDVIERVSFLITHHDDMHEDLEALGDAELDVLVAADTLSWFNFSGPNYFNGREKQGEKGLEDKMTFMLEKLPEKFWSYIPKLELKEQQMKEHVVHVSNVVAQRKGIPVPFPQNISS